MATNKTEHLGLNQWVLSDDVRMEDFNADNKKIDDFLSQPRCVLGFYHGMDSKDSEQFIELGFRPSLVQIFCVSVTATNRNAIFTPDYPVTSNIYTLAAVTDTGFMVATHTISTSPLTPHLNLDYEYAYIAYP